MKKFLFLTVISFLLVLGVTSISFGAGEPAPNPNDFTLYKSPQGLFEVMMPKGMVVIREHKDGVLYGDKKNQIMLASGVRLFGEGDDVKVDKDYIIKELNKAMEEIAKRNKEKVIVKPKDYKNGILMLVETQEPPFPPKEPPKEKKSYYISFYVTVKNEKTLAAVAYLPKEKYEDYKKTIDFIIDSLK